MDRRTFLKSVGAAISGLTGLLLLKAEPELTEEVLLDMINEGKQSDTQYISFTGVANNSAIMTLYVVDNEGNWRSVDQKTWMDETQTLTLGTHNLRRDGEGVWING